MLQLPASDPKRVYVIDDELELVKSALGQRGKRDMVAGQPVELLQLWVDEGGNACAIAQAGYRYPSNYSIKIDGRKSGAEPEGDPFSGRYWIVNPTVQNGRSIQLFYGNHDDAHQRTAYPDLVTVEIPVFKGNALAGYAKFERVRVNRAHNIHMLLEPSTMPFWSQSHVKGAASQAAP